MSDKEHMELSQTALDSEASAQVSIWNQLFEYCDDKRTGTLFIATNENKAGQVVLSDGVLVGIAYANTVNDEAVDRIEQLSGLRFSFSSGLNYPLKVKLEAEEASRLIARMGYIAKPVETETLPEPENQMLYRGQKVLIKDEQVSKTVTSAQRVYRGRKVPN